MIVDVPLLLSLAMPPCAPLPDNPTRVWTFDSPEFNDAVAACAIITGVGMTEARARLQAAATGLQLLRGSSLRAAEAGLLAGAYARDAAEPADLLATFTPPTRLPRPPRRLARRTHRRH